MSELLNELQKHTQLKLKGKNCVGACISCDSKDAFSYNIEKDFYHCFKCKISGSSISKLKNHLGIEDKKDIIALKGVITYYIERQTKSGKKYISFKINDQQLGLQWVSSFDNINIDFFKQKSVITIQCDRKLVGDKIFYTMI